MPYLRLLVLALLVVAVHVAVFCASAIACPFFMLGRKTAVMFCCPSAVEYLLSANEACKVFRVTVGKRKGETS